MRLPILLVTKPDLVRYNIPKEGSLKGLLLQQCLEVCLGLLKSCESAQQLSLEQLRCLIGTCSIILSLVRLLLVGWASLQEGFKVLEAELQVLRQELLLYLLLP